jgi:hypothetical protein
VRPHVRVFHALRSTVPIIESDFFCDQGGFDHCTSAARSCAGIFFGDSHFFYQFFLLFDMKKRGRPKQTKLFTAVYGESSGEPIRDNNL